MSIVFSKKLDLGSILRMNGPSKLCVFQKFHAVPRHKQINVEEKKTRTKNLPYWKPTSVGALPRHRHPSHDLVVRVGGYGAKKVSGAATHVIGGEEGGGGGGCSLEELRRPELAKASGEGLDHRGGGRGALVEEQRWLEHANGAFDQIFLCDR